MIYKNINIKWLGHSGFLIKSDLGNVYIDPFNLRVDEESAFSGAGNSEKADIIFITHSHYDHCSIEDIRKIVKDGTIIVCPADVSSKFSHVDKKVDIKIASPGTKMELLNSKLRFWTVPAYNTNKSFHSKDEDWNGYILQLKDIKLYHAGDTDLIPEMKSLNTLGLDIAFLPIGGTFTMNAGEAAKAAGILKPKIAIPMHYGSIEKTASKSESSIFAKYCSGEGIEVKVLEIED